MITKYSIFNESNKEVFYTDTIKTEYGFIDILIANYYDDGSEVTKFGKTINIIQNIQVNDKNKGHGKELYILALKNTKNYILFFQYLMKLLMYIILY